MADYKLYDFHTVKLKDFLKIKGAFEIKSSIYTKTNSLRVKCAIIDLKSKI